MPPSQRIYLNKNGKTFGPYKQAEIDELKRSGELDQYFWICFDLKQGWRPIAPPPPLPVEVEEATPISRNPRTEEPVIQNNSIVAICHNYKTILSGALKDIHAEGCTLTQVSPHGNSMPFFHRGTKVHLNLLDHATSQSENIQARVKAAVKNDGFWDYKLMWENVPLLLKRT